MLEAIRSAQALAFAGAGVSRPLGYPTWYGLIERFETETRARCGENISDDKGRSITVAQVSEMKDLLFRAEIFKCNLGDRYFEIIQEIFGPRDGQDSGIRDLISLPFQHILTSNYDIGLERAHDYLQQPYDSICLDDPSAFDFTNELGNYGYSRRIVHVHGRFDRPRNIILTEREYGAFYHNSAVVDPFWQTVARIRRCIFCGFSFNDTDLTAPFSLGNFNLARRGHGGVVHFALLPLDVEHGEPGNRAYYNMKYGIEPVFFNSVDEAFSGFSAVIRMIAKEIRPAVQELRVGLELIEPVAIAEVGVAEIPAPVAVPAVAHPVQEDVLRLEQLTETNLRKTLTGELG